MKECDRNLQVERANRPGQLLTFAYYTFEFFRKSKNGNVLGLGNPPLLSRFALLPWIFWVFSLGSESSKYMFLQGQSPLGVIALRPKSEALYVSSLATSPNCRRHGIGWSMLLFAETAARKASKKRLELTVAKANTPAQKLYVQFGFVFKEERRYSLVLEKEITSL